MMRFAILRFAILCGLFCICLCGAIATSSQRLCAQSASARASEWSVGVQTAAKIGFNLGNTSLTRSQVSFNTLPDASLVVNYRTDGSGMLHLQAMLGLAGYSSIAVANNPFGGSAFTNFRLSAQLQYWNVGVTAEFYRLFSIGFGYNIPIAGTYISAINVFDTGEQYDAERTIEFTSENLLQVLDVRLGVQPLVLPLGNGELSLHITGSYTLGPLVKPTNNPARQFRPNMNIIGLDPLAGVTFLTVQPISVSVGVRYMFSL